ncbi:hypothetical protein BCY89_13435 [Sphingobacterium siyangense]|uniref:Uncharacterized protein n=1 Tax=Sphingobacterium siyangense TaxID=459529 RepID=A0A420FJV4_9SPHI|nr:hypothetical protein [Sphingobacterium siyangense]RKF33222.1 hypothetical protein BCY89_13435 [Sphingobacterium siyangense]
MGRSLFLLFFAKILLTIHVSCSDQPNQKESAIDSIRNTGKNSDKSQVFPKRITLGSPVSKEIGLLKKVILENKKVNTKEEYENNSFLGVKYFFDPKNYIILKVNTDYPAILFEKYNYNANLDLTKNYHQFYQHPMVGFMQNNQIYIGVNANTAFENHSLFPIKFNGHSHSLVEKIGDRQVNNYQLVNKVAVDSLELKYGSNRVYFNNDWNLLKEPNPKNEFYEKVVRLKNSLKAAAQKKEINPEDIDLSISMVIDKEGKVNKLDAYMEYSIPEKQSVRIEDSVLKSFVETLKIDLFNNYSFFIPAQNKDKNPVSAYFLTRLNIGLPYRNFK